MNQFQQGDVCCERIETIPTGAKKLKTNIVRHGESGNKHVLEGDAMLFELDGKLYFAVGSDGASLVHEEHGVITYAPGNYVVTPGTFEYDYETEEAKQVQD